MKVLLLSGGRGHPASETAPALAPILGDDIDVYEDLQRGLQDVAARRHDLLVVNALACTMRDGRYSDADRQRWAFHSTPEGQAALDGWVGDGRPLLALHTAVVCFDDWPRWHDIVGGSWEWGRSWHDAPGPITVRSTLPGVAPFEVVDECYTDLRLDEEVDVVATAGTAPVAWRHRVGEARVACCTLGHGAASFATAGHGDLLRALLRWLHYEEGDTND